MAEMTQEVPRARSQVWSVIIGMSVFHLACLGAFYTGVSWAAFVVAFLMYVCRGMGVTTGFHRLLAHRSFKTSRPVQFLFALAGSLAVQGGPLWWVAHHRHHHAATETEEDIHSPVTHGMWKAHMGWMMTDAAFNEKGTNSRDLHKFPEIKFLQRHYVWLIIIQPVLMYAPGIALKLLVLMNSKGTNFILGSWKHTWADRCLHFKKVNIPVWLRCSRMMKYVHAARFARNAAPQTRLQWKPFVSRKYFH